MESTHIDLRFAENAMIRNTRPESYLKAVARPSGNQNESSESENISFNQDVYDSPYSTSSNIGPEIKKRDEEHSRYLEVQKSCENCVFTNNKHLPSTSSDASLLSSASAESSKPHLVVVCVSIQVSLFVATIAFIVVLFVMLHNVQSELEEEKHERQKDSNMFCVPCNDLILGPMEEDNADLKLLIKRREGEIYICCAKGSNQTSVLMDLLFRRREKLQETQEIIDSEDKCKCNITHGSSGSIPRGKISAHLLAGVQAVKGSPPYTVNNWIQTTPTAHSSGIQVKDSRIVVNTSGLYFVYSQILFSNLYNGQTALNKSQALYHYVYRWNIIYPNSGNELLLKSVRTQCWAENRIYGDYTSYTAGTFKLNTGDELYVQASKIDSISRDMHASFFGIIKL